MLANLGHEPTIEHCSTKVALLENIRLGSKGLLGTITLAYSASSSVIKKIGFITVTLGYYAIKQF
jgi:hypothetical protein